MTRTATIQRTTAETDITLTLGLDGTGRRRFDDPSLTGLAHLKTGSLDHVSAVSGYLQSRSGRRFALVVLQNAEDIHRGPGDEVHIALMKWLNQQ